MATGIQEDISIVGDTGEVWILYSGVVQVASGSYINVVSASGQSVGVSGQIVVAKTSGEVALISGEQVVVASGAILGYTPPTGLKHGYTLVGAQSGGIELSSGAVVAVKIKNVSQSSKIWVGSANDPIQSGEGFLLTITAGDNQLDLDIDNLNRIYVLSEVSGGLVSWMGEAE